ncbi:MAG: YggT family protein [Anaerolineaceae bacterium]|jgi:YggT family protein|nr:YggT family protein [Anaerolineaceae bacterium]
MAQTLIQAVFQLLTLIIIVDAIISFFMSPYHPFRQFLDRIVNPLLEPIRRVVPPLMNMDFSPVILLLLLQFVEYLLLRMLA